MLIRFEITPEVTLLAHSASMQCPASQSALREFWRGGQADRMCALEIAKAWALREASRELQGGKDKLPWVAARVVKNDGTHPSREALRQLFVTIDSDPDWFPGKHKVAQVRVRQWWPLAHLKRGGQVRVVHVLRRSCSQCAPAEKEMHQASLPAVWPTLFVCLCARPAKLPQCHNVCQSCV